MFLNNVLKDCLYRFNLVYTQDKLQSVNVQKKAIA